MDFLCIKLNMVAQEPHGMEDSLFLNIQPSEDSKWIS